MNILQMSITAGVLVIAIVLIRAVALNRLPKKMFLVLWGVVLFRLLVPVSIPLPFSIPSIISEVSNMVLPDTSAPSVTDNSIYTGDPVVGTTETPGKAAQTFSIAPTTAIWLIGILAAFIFFAVIFYKNHKGLRYATLIHDNDFLNEWLAEYRLTRPIAIMQSDRIKTPLAVGIIKPRIILPKSMNMSDKQLLDYVLTHEYYHIKRFDALWKLLLVFALCVHWFNPLVWVMFVLVNRDLEMTCDEMVIRRFGAETKTAYAYTLIGLAEQRSRFAPLYNGFSRNATEERIESIMKIKKTPLFALVLAVVLVSVLTVGVLAASADNTQNDKPAATSKGLMLTGDCGNGTASNGLNLQRSERFTLNSDGSLSNAPDDKVDSLYDSFNIPPSSFNVNGTSEGDTVTSSFITSDCNLGAANNKKAPLTVAPRTYTDEEMAQIIADIESGKIQPYTIPEGAEVFFNDGENCITVNVNK